MTAEVLPTGMGIEALLEQRQTYLTTGVVPEATRPVVAASWRRSRAFGVAPDRIVRQRPDRERLRTATARSARLLSAAVPLLEQLHAALEEHPHLIALADVDAVILWLRTDDACKGMALDESNLFEGASWRERDIGCNGIGTSLAIGAPVALVGPEHFSDAYVGWTCVGIPLRDATGTIFGSLDLSVPNEHVQLHTWGLVLTVARAIEQQLTGAAAPPAPADPPKEPFAALRGILELLVREEASGDRNLLLREARTALEQAEQGFRHAMDEIAQRKSALDAYSRYKEQSLGEFVHEMRNALTAFRTTIAAMAMRTGDSAMFDRARTALERRSEEMNRLVDDLLDAQLIEHGKLRLQRESVNLGEVVELAAAAVREAARRHRHRLRLNIPRHLNVDGDRIRLVQIVTNLLTNAVRYTPDDGSITVDAGRQGAEIELRVRDSGHGIDADLLPRLFDPFVQGPRGHHSGLGLGLNLVQRLVTAHGGSISAHSDGPGRGSEFRVRLPASEPARVVGAG